MSLLVLARCGGTTPVVAPIARGEDRYLIDPRIGYAKAAAPKTERRFDGAWTLFLSGDLAEAQRRFSDLATRDGYPPAALASMAIEIRAGRLQSAALTVQSIQKDLPDYLAARVYAAEIVYRERNLRSAYDLYRQIAARPDAPPEVRERLTQVEGALFNEIYRDALAAPDDEAIRLLREALAITPGASDARVVLVQKLIVGRKYDDARRELDPLLSSGEVDRAEVQEALAEIDVGRGRYQEAIIRYDRLARRTKSDRYAARLDEIKQRWTAANLPPQVQRALDSDSITRADFAILLYWKVASVRFAQNLGAPPIAIDIADGPGREEMIRAIAIGVFQVDPVTRRVDPGRTIAAATLARLAARILVFRGAPCVRDAAADVGEQSRAQKILTACGVTDPGATDSAVSGRQAAAVLDGISQALASTEKR
ncbi:MAG TPA: tetratricopeptide repeat protein [Thermoanaerobaculia bacterium]|nr:tetratricopeptide repeat protein [Thermoanaerobaculia bacterium]